MNDQLDNTVKDRLHSSYARILVGFLLSLMFLNQILKTILTDWIPGQVYITLYSSIPGQRFLCALLHPILKELRAERVTGEDGTEEKMLGFWSLLVLSVGCICCVFSWMLTYLDSFQPGMDFPTLWTVAHVRDV
uniref:Uncharacterized protein n=1 Tax=Astatotilapia calliptera TaxID=8154 RepID=A0A3P8NWD8_ASTCA